MLILGAIFNCLDPIMTVVAGLSVRDPFLMPADKKDVSHHDYRFPLTLDVNLARKIVDFIIFYVIM